MPSYRCKHPTCAAILPRPGRCPAHAPAAAVDQAERHRLYDRGRRDRDARAFYSSTAWQLARREKISASPVCEICQADWSKDVHHKLPVRDFPEQRLDQANLQALCPRCHKRIEAARRLQKKRGAP